jgi:hypothetical protein
MEEAVQSSKECVLTREMSAVEVRELQEEWATASFEESHRTQEAFYFAPNPLWHERALRVWPRTIASVHDAAWELRGHSKT